MWSRPMTLGAPSWSKTEISWKSTTTAPSTMARPSTRLASEAHRSRFEVGTGQVIPGFDDAVRGLRIGESREVRIPPAEAYGEWSDENVVELPYGPDQADVAVGDQVYLTTGQAAIVLEVKKDTVVLDANHELAGEALTFKIEVLSITRP